MDISNNQQPPVQIKPLSAFAKVFCCIVLFVCSAALALLPYYISTEGIPPAVPVAILFAVLALGVAFILTLCRKPLFLTCALLGGLIVALFGSWLAGLYVALLCGTVAGAALLADAKRAQYLPLGILSVAAFGAAFALTGEPLLAASVLLPALLAVALAICYKKKYSIIIGVGAATGTLAIAYVLLLGAEALMAGMPFSVQGVTDYIKAYHAAVSGMFAESMQLMAETPELAEQLTLMLGGEITPELITDFSDSVATAVVGMLPGVTIMVCWIFCFIAHRGFTAMLVRGMEKKDYPTHLTAYEPSLPTAIFVILCYAALLISSLFPQAEVVTFIALNLVLALLPLMSVCGILSIISNIKQAPVKWPLLLTYALSVIFLGVAVVPMLAFFGAFAVIMQAIARALEQKFNEFKGGQ